MNRGDYQQLELFSNSKNSYAQNKTDNDKSFFGCVRNYEKIILLVILCIAVAIMSFYLGVEKGKRLTSVKQIATAVDPAVIDEAQKPVQPQKQEIKISALAQSPQGRFLDPPVKNYTIQLASFKSKTQAQKEISMLKKGGVESFVLRKGQYNILCSGKFGNINEAEKTLREFKKKYPDSFIRRL